MSNEDYTAQQKAGLVAWQMAHGAAMQTRDVAELTGLSMMGSLYLMWNLSCVIPIYQDDRGIWTVCATIELEHVGIEA